MARKQFQWDTEELLTTYQESEKKEHDIKLCTLGEKEYVAATEKQMTPEGWKIKKNRVLSRELFEQIRQVVKW
jgi:hypothetical protein